jgi:hypothetical protein
VCINTLWGHKNTMTVVLTGLDIEKKAAIVEETLFQNLGGRENFAETHVQLIRSDRENPDHNDLAFAHLRITVMDPDPKKAGRLFSSKVVELALASIPGFTLTGPPSQGDPAIRHWPALVSSDLIRQEVHVKGQVLVVDPAPTGAGLPSADDPGPPPAGSGVAAGFALEEMRAVPFGRLFATRSGDKGGNANLGVWAREAKAYNFLSGFLTCDRLKILLPDLAPYAIQRYELPNLLAVNFYIRGLLGHGVAASVRSDPQAKTLGEYLRAKMIDAPVSLLKDIKGL